MRHEHDLAERTALPDDLRVMLSDYPRRIWGDHPNFGPTTRFYLDRHAMFRECLSVMRRLTAEGLDAPRPEIGLARNLGRVGGFFLQELHTHHGIEDDHYFPALAKLEPRLSRAFALLDGDHRALHDAMAEFAAAADAAMKAVSAGAGVQRDPHRALGALDAQLTRFERLMGRHLDDEEEVVIPIMLHCGERALNF